MHFTCVRLKVFSKDCLARLRVQIIKRFKFPWQQDRRYPDLTGHGSDRKLVRMTEHNKAGDTTQRIMLVMSVAPSTVV